jgi:hypothetical protein
VTVQTDSPLAVGMSDPALPLSNALLGDFSPLLARATARAELDEVDIGQDRSAEEPRPNRWGGSRFVGVPNAVVAAFDLADRPGLARVMRATELPAGVLVLIQIAAGGTETVRGLVSITGRDTAFIRAAATVYIERILWAPDGDHYRALGVNRDARPREIAKHLLWFAKWVSQDWGWSELEHAFSQKVLTAWDTLKSPRLRREYDRAILSAPRVRDVPDARVRLLPPEDRIRWVVQPIPAQKEHAFELPDAEPWKVAALGASVIAVTAVAMLNWVIFQIPASASASSLARSSFELRMVNPDPRPDLAAGRAQSMRTYIARAKDNSRLIPTSGN